MTLSKQVKRDNLVPEQFKQELIQIRERNKDDSWRIGDIANVTINFWENKAETDPSILVSRMAIYDEVSEWCGRPSRTVRHYSRIAEFYSPSERTEFDILSFEHFRIGVGRAEWREILETAVRGIEEKGRIVTVEKLIARYGDNGEYTEGEGLVNDYREQVDDSIDRIAIIFGRMGLDGETYLKACQLLNELKIIVKGLAEAKKE